MCSTNTHNPYENIKNAIANDSITDPDSHDVFGDLFRHPSMSEADADNDADIIVQVIAILNGDRWSICRTFFITRLMPKHYFINSLVQ